MNVTSSSSCKSGALSILYFNARSLLPKIDELRALSRTHKPHIICIVESWLDETILDSELCIGNYDIVRLDRNRHGGSVLLYIISSLSHHIVFSGSSDLELIVVSVNLPLSKVAIGLFYRPPCSPSPVLIMYLLLCAHMLMFVCCPILSC